MLKNIIFSFVLLAAVFGAYSISPKHIAENKFANIVLRSSASIEDSPQRSLQCFALYVPQLNDLAAQFEAEWEACLQRSTDARTVVEQEVQSDRNNVENSAIQICGGFQNCSTAQTTAYDFFECYSIVAEETTRTAFNIQNTANDKMAYITLKYTTIEFDQNRCTDDSSRAYVEESAAIYNQLERCLAGEVITTAIPTTTESTTVAPIISTTESTTTGIPTPPGGF